MKDYDELLTAWESSVENFLKFAIFCAGVNEESDLYRSLVQEIKSKQDLDLFIELFDGDIDRLDLTLDKFMWKKAG